MVSCFFYLNSKHYAVVNKKINLTLTFEQVIFEKRSTSVLFYNTLCRKKKTINQMIKLNNQKAEMVLLVFFQKQLTKAKISNL